MLHLFELNIYRQLFTFFILLCMLNCKVTKEQGRNLIFEILIQSKMLEIIDLFDDIWEIFNV